MPRKAREALDPKGREIRFYSGDWDRLSEILAPRKISPSEFIREMVNRKIREVENALPRKEFEI